MVPGPFGPLKKHASQQNKTRQIQSWGRVRIQTAFGPCFFFQIDLAVSRSEATFLRGPGPFGPLKKGTQGALRAFGPLKQVPKGTLGAFGPFKKSLRSGIHTRNPPRWPFSLASKTKLNKTRQIQSCGRVMIQSAFGPCFILFCFGKTKEG